MRDPGLRLGSLRGIKELKEHRFFTGIDWKNLSKGPAPWRPKRKDDLELGNFPDAKVVDMDLMEENRSTAGLDTTTKDKKKPVFDKFQGLSV